MITVLQTCNLKQGAHTLGKKKKNTCSLISPELNNTVGVSIMDSREPRGETAGGGGKGLAVGEKNKLLISASIKHSLDF